MPTKTQTAGGTRRNVRTREGAELRKRRQSERGENRKTRPAHWQPYLAGGIGIIPRRVLPSGIRATNDLAKCENLERYSVNSAFRLFEILLDIHPSLKQAKSNALRLVFGEGKTRFVAFLESGDAKGTDTRDDALTSEIEDLLKDQPDEMGGMVGLQSALAVGGLAHGMGCLEAVPGPRGTGIRRLWVVDPLTISLGRPNNDADADIAAYQRQDGLSGAGSLMGNGWVEMPAATFKWAPIDPTPQNPYGVGIYSAAYNQSLADLAGNQDLRDAVRNAAWPRTDYMYKIERIIAYGRDTLKLNATIRDDDGLTALDRYVAAEVESLRGEVEVMNPDDNPVHSEDIVPTPLAAGDFRGLSEPLQMERHRLVQSVDELPTLMGINDGSTQTYTSVEWGIRATKAEWLRDWVNTIIIWSLELHFLLQGKVVTVRAECDPIRTSEALSDAQTREIETRTEAAITDRGLQTLEDESMNVTNSGLPDDPDARKRQERAQSGAGPEANPPAAPPSAPTTTDKASGDNPAENN